MGTGFKSLCMIAFGLAVLTVIFPHENSLKAQTQSEGEEKDRKTIPMPIDLPALAEIDSLDEDDAAIRRFFLTSQGMRGQTVPIEGTEGWFCTLSLATHVYLDYWPTLDQWVFQIAFDEEAELTAGGLATCHRLRE